MHDAGRVQRWRRRSKPAIPHEGTNDIAWGIIRFDRLAAYEAGRARIKSDVEGCASFDCREDRFILREERSFVEIVEAP